MNTVYSQFNEIVKKYPQSPAVIDSGRIYTFSDLTKIIDEICGQLPKANLKTAGIVLEHGVKMIASMFAALKAGACYVPAEPDFPLGRIELMFEEAGADLVITQSKFAQNFNKYPLYVIDEPHAQNKQCAERPVITDAPAYILYTSGTTGLPKGVLVTNGNILHYARAFDNEFKPRPGDIMLQYSVCTFDIFVEEVFATLLNGAAIAIPSEDEKSDIKSLINFIEKNKVTIVSGFPYLFEEINKNGVFPASLRLFLSGGDILRASYIDKIPGRIQVYNTYGPSETTVCASYYSCRNGQVLKDGAYPIGKPVLGADIKILDKDGAEVKAGEIGEICIFGGGVSQGYIGDHELENRAFETRSGERMYRSGDLGYFLKSGDIAYLGRKDSQVMIDGRRVETAEVLSRLYELGEIEQAFVRADTDENGLAYMTAYIVPEGEVKLSELKNKLSKYLADYMIPEFFVKVKEIPKNENGKPDLSALPAVMK